MNTRSSKYIIFIILINIIFLGMMFSSVSLAKEEIVSIIGVSYDLGKSSKYDISNYDGSAAQTSTYNVYGKLKVSGDISKMSDGISNSYEINEGNVLISYEIDEDIVNSVNRDWTLLEDNLKEVDGIKLDKKVGKGALIIQTSIDGKIWSTQVVQTNIFADEAYKSDLYLTTDIQKINGCYYRVIVAYEQEKDDNNGWTVNEKRRCAEVYEFYMVDANVEQKQAGNKNAGNVYYFKDAEPKKVDSKGYVNEEEIFDGDPHYNMDVGNFFVSGYTDSEIDLNTGTIVFLKDIGDEVTLWFNLEQDIKCLNGNNDLSIAMDEDGYDQYFKTNKNEIDFNRGTLILRYTDKTNAKSDPIIYTDYLAANAKMGANTRVQLFEEGNYEVALDYMIKDAKGFDKYTAYRIFFKFEIRNGGCKIFTFDKGSGTELMNNEITSTGFKIDTAKSEYLNVDVTYQIISIDSNGLINLDKGISERACDQKEYTKEGIYTIMVTNEYTKKDESIVIYVGDSKELLALSEGKYNVENLNEKLREGYTINDDGSLNNPVSEEAIVKEGIVESEETTGNEAVDGSRTEQTDRLNEEKTSAVESASDNNAISVDSPETNNSNGFLLVVGIGGILLGAIAVSAFALTKKKGK